MNDTEIHYCKQDKKDGVPIHVTDSKTREVVKTDHWKFEGFDKDMNPIVFEIKFNNSTGKAKASGASAVMKLKYV